MPPLDRDAARRLVTQPAAAALRFERSVVDRIVEVTGGRPEPIQRVCQLLFRRAAGRRGRRVTRNDLDAVLQTEDHGDRKGVLALRKIEADIELEARPDQSEPEGAV